MPGSRRRTSSILGERAGVVLSLLEKLRGLEMRGGIGRQGRGQGHEFRIGLGARVFLEQELDQFDASFVAVGVGIGVPDSVHGIVVVTSGVFDGTAVGGDAGESKIDGGVLRSALPESEEVGFGLVETAGIVAVAQGAGQAELVLGVGGIAGEGGAEGGDGVVVAAGAGIVETLRVKLAAAGLLVGVCSG